MYMHMYVLIDAIEQVRVGVHVHVNMNVNEQE